MLHPEEHHLLLGRLTRVRELDALLSTPLPSNLSPEQIHVLSGELPAGFNASRWRESAVQRQLRRNSAWHWIQRGILIFLPFGIIGMLWGDHWLWLPGMLASGAVWGWFAHFYWRLFRAERRTELQSLGLSGKDRDFIQGELADGATILILTLHPMQVDDAERWLSAHGIPAYHVLV